jgi:IS30 family transposase
VIVSRPSDAALIRAWPRLTPQQRLIVCLYYWAEEPMTVREIAAGLGLRGHMHIVRSLQRIRRKAAE